MTNLFEPFLLGDISVSNRVFMAPMTRARSTRDHVPTDMMIEYYRQRAGAGLIISEGTGISLEGLGWPYAPGIWSEEQVEAWKPVTEAVHAEGGKIVCQLWHMGRVVHPTLPGRGQPVSSSATTMQAMVRTYEGKFPAVEAHALTVSEIARVADDYRRAAANAIAAGFDGIELHAANGYLIDQFLRDNANLREDEYGGPVNNRIRFLLEMTNAVVDAAGAGRTGVRMSPNEERQGVNDSNPQPLFEAASRGLSEIGIAFLEIREPGFDGTNGVAEHPPIGPSMREAFVGGFIVNSDYDSARARAALDDGLADAVSFGRPFIANPDLPERIAEGVPLAVDDMTTWYLGGTEGYTDYPRRTERASTG